MTTRLRTVGVDIGGTNIKIAVVWNDGTVVVSKQIPTWGDAGPQQASARMIDAVRNLMRAEKLEPAEMRALGIDSAGLVDAEKNIVTDSPNLRSWEKHPLAQELSDAIGVPAFLENDVNAMAYGEWRSGAGRGTRHLVCLTLGTGVGGGLILDGKLYRGANGAAGELGHMTLDVHGPPCSCPNLGCLERHVGAAWIVERTLEKLGHDSRPSRLRRLPSAELSPKNLSDAAESGDELAAEILDETGVLLGMGLVSLVNAFNPERVVIGGGVAQAGERLFEPARRTIRRHAMSVQAATVEVVPAALGNDAAVVGAALLALERVPDSDVHA
ncbi:MAG: ROK family protein [Candidatus Krumholzibacteriia bacterium]